MKSLSNQLENSLARTGRCALGGLAIVLALIGAACVQDDAANRGRVLVLGYDGLDPDVVAELAGEGLLPNFQTLLNDGAHGPLESIDPMLSPLLWTTIATGREPLDHGVTNFVVRSPDGEETPVTRLERKVPALWNRATAKDLASVVVGWWATWPAEEVNGAVVSDRASLHFLLTDDDDSGLDVPGVTHPRELASDLEPFMMTADQLPKELVGEFINGNVSFEREDQDPAQPFADDDEHVLWAVAAAVNHHQIGRHLWRELNPDLHLVYYEVTDTVAHLFGHLHRRSDLKGELQRQQERYGNAVTAAYVLADRLLGEVLSDLDAETTLLIVSDHGFELGALPEDPGTLRTMRRVSHESHEILGSYFAYGYRVKQGARVSGARLIDVAPTILDLLDLPVPSSFPGRTLANGFVDLQSKPRVDDDPVSLQSAQQMTDTAAPELLDKLRSLGYLGGASGSANLPDRNEASLALRSGDYRRAGRLFRVLADAEPEVAGHQLGLATAMFQLGRYEQAIETFDHAIELEPTLASAYFNRGLAHGKMGSRLQAINDYRSTLRLNPGHARARQELEGLGESVTGRVATSEFDLENVALLERVKLASQRGDLTDASNLLSELETRAPENPVVHEYRSNVEFLQGNLVAARDALLRAQQLDPTNPRVQANLRRLNARLDSDEQ